MTRDDFLDAVRSDNDTALSRLGSSKSLYAATGGEMEPNAVYRAAADAEHAVFETFQSWAEDTDDQAVREAFETTAAEERDHYETVAAKLDGHEPDADPSAMQAFLRDLDDPVERVGGLLGRTLATEKSKEQLTGFFVGQADPQAAQLFRELKADLDDQFERGLDLLEARCESDADWERAREAATGAIQAAYEEYTESLEAMGVNPKPVC
jgi:hypothetical protein